MLANSVDCAYGNSAVYMEGARKEQVMCKIISLSALDKRARDFVEMFGGCGIVADEEEREEPVTIGTSGEDCEDEAISKLLKRKPTKIIKGEMW